MGNVLHNMEMALTSANGAIKKGTQLFAFFLICYGSSLCSSTDISQKHKMGDIKKGVTNSLYPTKKKKILSCYKR
jgi:hypothetical protein